MKKILSIVGVILLLGLAYFYYFSASGTNWRVSHLSKKIQNTAHTEAIDVASCKLVRTGHCGSPVVIYSTESTDVEKLESLVKKQKTLITQYGERNKTGACGQGFFMYNFSLIEGQCVGSIGSKPN